MLSTSHLPDSGSSTGSINAATCLVDARGKTVLSQTVKHIHAAEPGTNDHGIECDTDFRRAGGADLRRSSSPILTKFNFHISNLERSGPRCSSKFTLATNRAFGVALLRGGAAYVLVSKTGGENVDIHETFTRPAGPRCLELYGRSVLRHAIGGIQRRSHQNRCRFSDRPQIRYADGDGGYALLVEQAPTRNR